MKKIQKAILLSSAIIGIISVFTPVVFHISTNYLYQFWSWGTSLFFGLSSTEIGSTQNTELEFLIPALSSVVLILLSSGLILKSSLKGSREGEFNSKITFIGGIIMLTIPILLMIIWQLIYTLIRGYPTYWGSDGIYNYFMPSFSIYLQLLAGLLAISSILITKLKKK